MELKKERMLEIAEILYSRDFCFGDSCCKHCEKVQAVDSRDVICFYNRVIDLLQADADGRLVLLPCKVGEKVFAIYTSIKGTNPMICRVSFEESMIPLFGKYVFLTREEAEAALEKMGGGEK